MNFHIREDLYVAGRTEDGQQYTASMYYVAAEWTDGRRWAHGRTFRGCNVMTDEEGYQHFADVREHALNQARTLLASIEDHNPDATPGQLDHSFNWNEMPAAYGSAAHSDEEMIGWEKSLTF